jgi:hypothetical protein
MIRTLILILLTAAMLWLPTSGRALAQQQPQHQPGLQRQREAQPHTQTPVRPTGIVYQRRDSWYEFLLKQFNPSDVDYGQWIEQRRQTFREARLRNPYFGYSFGMTVALLLMLGVCTKIWIDHRRAMCVTAEMMTDIFNHDQYSREVARQAIQKYNDHIERCNRAVEAAAQGIATPTAGSDAEALRAELQRVAGERDRYLQERDIAKSELEAKGKILAELSLRLDGVSSKPGTTGDSQSPGLRTSDPVVVQHINNLQEQLYAERQKNRQMKGA